jgi:cystathionine beta-lyase family protein involved in aluminum resistance
VFGQLCQPPGEVAEVAEVTGACGCTVQYADMAVVERQHSFDSAPLLYITAAFTGAETGTGTVATGSYLAGGHGVADAGSCVSGVEGVGQSCRAAAKEAREEVKRVLTGPIVVDCSKSDAWV